MRKLATRGAQARRALDGRYAQLTHAKSVGVRPSGGWIRTMREALGMSVADLAARMDVVPSTVHRVEASERNDHIQLATLRRAADALNCDLVYALVPRRTLEETVNDRAVDVARRELVEVGHTMSLEAQGLSSADLDDRVRELAEVLKTRPGLWRD